MRISKLIGERVKEIPAGVVAKSHKLLLRAGFIKQVSNGIFTLLPPAEKINLKIQNIIRKEMNKVDGQEILMPVVMPKELWEKSGRYYSIGSEMVRFKDRNNHDMLLGMTHEEAAVHAALNTIKSYDQLPFMIYQFQTKFRDEARPRAGLLRVKEFTMKDGYSFHTSQEDLEAYYQRVFDAYNNIYKKIGMKNFVSVTSDSGMMGGEKADEFQLLIDAGEDDIVICPSCNHKANMEIASGKMNSLQYPDEKVEEVYTGSAKTIAEVCSYLNIKPSQTIKAVCYAIINNEEDVVVCFIRGDREINEAKLKKILKQDIAVKDLADTGLVKGNIGCYNLNIDHAIILYDKSLEGLTGLVTGANKEDFHIKGINMKRDINVENYVDIAKVAEGDLCPICGKPLTIKKGIEIGNIFQLGTKYTQPMGMTIHMPDGNQINPLMGCYGIGVGRCLAAVVEESSDEKGMIWPVSITPWEIYLCPLRLDNDIILEKSEELYNKLSNSFDVLYDDRTVSPGVKFADSELMGIPVRVVISPRSLENNQAEVVIRRTSEKLMIDLNNLENELTKIIDKLKEDNN